jgi:hypothetical protein
VNAADGQAHAESRRAEAKEVCRCQRQELPGLGWPRAIHVAFLVGRGNRDAKKARGGRFEMKDEWVGSWGQLGVSCDKQKAELCGRVCKWLGTAGAGKAGQRAQRVGYN